MPREYLAAPPRECPGCHVGPRTRQILCGAIPSSGGKTCAAGHPGPVAEHCAHVVESREEPRWVPYRLIPDAPAVGCPQCGLIVYLTSERRVATWTPVSNTPRERTQRSR